MNKAFISFLSAISAILFVVQKEQTLAWIFLVMALVLSSFSFSKGERTAPLFFLLPFSLYFFSTSFIDGRNTSSLEPGQTSLTFYINDAPYVNGNQLTTTIETIDGETLLLLGYAKEEVELYPPDMSIGSICQAKGDLTQPPNARNRFGFDYRQYLYYQHIHMLYRVTQLATITCKPLESQPFVTKLQEYRHSATHRLQEQLPPSLSGIVLALTFGERRYIEPDVMEAYSKLGVIHLLAISGLHVGILTGTSFYLMIRIGIPREIVLISLLMFLPVFIILTGASPPVIRAAIMTMIYFFLVLLRVPIHPFYGFSSIFLLYLLIQPYALFQLGFQLSFLVSFTLILMQKPIMNRYHSYGKRLFCVTTIAQLVGLPLIAYHFFQWSPLSLLINLVYIPFVSLVLLPYSFFLVFLSELRFIPLDSFVVASETLLVWIHKWIVELGNHVYMWVMGRPSIVLVLLLYGCLVVIGLLWEKRSRWTWVVIGLFCVTLAIPSQLPKLNGDAVITMLDVGQGDSFLIETPNRKEVYLVDTGGVMSFATEDWEEKKKTFDTGKDIVVPYLKAKGIKTITGLILTHGDFDHIGGAKAVLENVHVENVYYPEGELEKEIEIELFQQVEDEKMVLVQVGDTISTQFYVLHPTNDRKWSGNDQSIVLYGSFHGKSILLTGDLEEEGEMHLLNSFPNLEVDLLKVGHHGSRTSTQEPLLDQLRPKIALVSAGVNNRFGHPHPDVLKRLQARDIQVYQTNVDGTVELSIGSDGINIRKSVYQVNEKTVPESID
ncbi:DNA internalization-related competence protein ComEC/Rec2 [Shouchella miscanthi]|uniref:DNA internalization-related competence protein ComEC/Rec2 n=1 Tax=Shouchella miscanthi TaxID=2598861 RepID=A0ABU6NI34_9BACI|nr:DNA internalization-related competence protein ComEC/Rec2 [Shouchella miscanthi]MED4127857.1 DNA internalization-related competence protein ComEC/Rec2 [Shouchella miscanthi]